MFKKVMAMQLYTSAVLIKIPSQDLSLSRIKPDGWYRKFDKQSKKRNLK